MHLLHISFVTMQITRYACAVLLILSSITMVFIELFRIDDVPDGLIFYIAQAFLLAGSIFGLDYYIKKITEMTTTKPTHHG